IREEEAQQRRGQGEGHAAGQDREVERLQGPAVIVEAPLVDDTAVEGPPPERRLEHEGLRRDEQRGEREQAGQREQDGRAARRHRPSASGSSRRSTASGGKDTVTGSPRRRARATAADSATVTVSS